MAQVADGNVPESGAAVDGEAHAPIPEGVVGREQELVRLKTLAQALACGQRQTVFITGPTGIGKTALVDAACHQMVAMLSASVACSQCVEGLSKKEDYYAVMEILRQLCASGIGETAIRILKNMAPAWLPAPVPGSQSPRQSKALRRSKRRQVIYAARLEELAKEKALVLVFEDLQWANDSTLELISALARRKVRHKVDGAGNLQFPIAPRRNIR